MILQSRHWNKIHVRPVPEFTIASCMTGGKALFLVKSKFRWSQQQSSSITFPRGKFPSDFPLLWVGFSPFYSLRSLQLLLRGELDLI